MTTHEHSITHDSSLSGRINSNISNKSSNNNNNIILDTSTSSKGGAYTGAFNSNTKQIYIYIFNLKHSALRNVVERTFGVLKRRFAILRDMHCFSLVVQTKIIVVCMLHGKSALAEKPNSFGSSWAKRFFKRHKIS